MTPLVWIILAAAALFAYMPQWTRADLYFAVTVRPDFFFTPEARRILRQYWLELALHTLIALAIAGLAGRGKAAAALLAIGWQIGGAGWATARAHRATLAHSTAPSAIREAGLVARRLPAGWPLAFGPFVFLALAAIYAALGWDRLPPRIAVHWGLQGADRWVERTPLHVGLFLSLLAAFCGAFLLVAYGTLRWSRRISASGEPARSESSFRNGVLWLMIVLPYVVVVPAVLLALGLAAPAVWIWLALILLVIGAALIRLIPLGQGGSRAVGRTDDQVPVGDRTPDEAWKWGLLYYNPADPALIVEKRLGMGYTLNFGNRWSWLVMAALLVPAGLLIALR